MIEDVLVQKAIKTHTGRRYVGFAQEAMQLARRLKKIGLLAAACKKKKAKEK